MPVNIIPEWLANLDDEDIIFIKKFLLSSGSLKEMAEGYKVTYPTVRLRLDKLIKKIQIADDSTNDNFIKLIKQFVLNERFNVDTAKILINEYKKTKGEQ